MGKKVSPILFRINRFNNYKNVWVFDYKKYLNIKILKYYYILNKLLNILFINFKFFYLNIIQQIYIKISVNLINSNIIKKLKFINNIYLINLNIFFKFYKIINSFFSIRFIKLFLVDNLQRYNSIQILYHKLLTYIFLEKMSCNICLYSLKIIISGRLNNTKLASSEIFQLGNLPAHSIESYICYEQFHIKTKYGLLGIKIWLYKFYK